LSRAGNSREAVEQVCHIVEREKRRILPAETLVTALKTRIINPGCLGRSDEAHDDPELSKRILAEYPHLRAQVDHISEVDDDDDRERQRITVTSRPGYDL
jgi:hypothetical protein